jgi:alpha-L-fucosidase
MTLTRREILAGSLLSLASAYAPAETAQPPRPFGALPSERQLRWQLMETNAFLHFTVNAFTDKEWGDGDEDPSVFNPDDFDPDSIVASLKAGGMKGVILTCKHHDGFCLWPTKTTDHCIRASRWRDGKGDVVRDISQAAARQGLKFGVYLSPWDRNNAAYGKPEYIALYRAQLTELLNGYGPIFEVWFDGANGGSGYYGGAHETRTIDPVTTDGKPGVPGDAEPSVLNAGTRFGSRWLPPECDVSIRPGWFWHERENNAVKTPDQLLDLYFESVGRGANLLLNVPPNRHGRLSPEDAEAIARFHEKLEAMFTHNLAAGAKLKASNVRERDPRFGPERLLDGSPDTFWATDDDVHTGELVLDFGRMTRFNVFRLREAIQLGQRIGAFALDRWEQNSWSQVAQATSVGACRLIRLPSAIETTRLRVRIADSAACLALADLGVFLEG